MHNSNNLHIAHRATESHSYSSSNRTDDDHNKVEEKAGERAAKSVYEKKLIFPFRSQFNEEIL